jgi:hypothetical protein
MTTRQKTIHDVLTGEIVTRDFNETELAELEATEAQLKKDAAAKIKADQAAADKRQIILDRLGITNDEFKTLIS